MPGKGSLHRRAGLRRFRHRRRRIDRELVERRPDPARGDCASGTASRSQFRQNTTWPSSDSIATARAWPAASGTSGIASSRREPNANIGTCGPGTFVTVTLNRRVP